MKRFTLALILMLAAFGVAHAQLVLVTAEYYVTEVKQDDSRVGVALHRGDDTRNWVHVKFDTKINQRTWHDGGFTDAIIPPEQFWRVVKPGMRFKVSGGRAWDQSIVAKKIWI